MVDFRERKIRTLGGILLGLSLGHCGAETPSSAPRSGESQTLFDAPAPEAADDVHAPLSIPADAPTVVFLGDSIGAGLHLAEHQAFPAVLQRRLHDAGQPFHLVSSCESGRTTAGGVTALNWVLRRKPDLVVLQLGANDGLRGIKLAEVERNLRTMIETTTRKGTRLLLLGVRIPPNYGDYAVAFDAIYPRLAKEYDLPIVPSFMRDVGAVPEMNFGDGLHPTARGHEKLADNVQEGFAHALAEAAERD